MEKDTVLLSLKDYNELREFKEEVLKGKVVSVRQSYNDFSSSGFSSGYRIIKYFTESKAIAEISDRYKIEIEKAEDCHLMEIKSIKNDNKDNKDYKEEIKSLSWFQLFKLKISLR